eukprot:NODE_2070_length_1288_cov_17.735573_g1970_i0.p1 GENE.NODE_2070_length_1288_cov_17.735573_g1970_i0~~NODE_2070_length_1288_cov_17.735573_g1970_i0.p1  ORF type:complete len:415 (+),score=77.27 NODE_2070_length_1288_cov_17.735573_g1970_i0:35-1246(+)
MTQTLDMKPKPKLVLPKACIIPAQGPMSFDPNGNLLHTELHGCRITPHGMERQQSSAGSGSLAQKLGRIRPSEFHPAGTSISGAPIWSYSLAPFADQEQRLCFSDFHRLRTLGSGATSYVLLVNYKPAQQSEPTTAQRFAMKCISAHAHTAKALAAELSVIQNRSLIATPHIVQSYEAFIVENEVCILMEWMHMGSIAELRRHSNHRRIPSKPLQSILIQVLCGLRFLHNMEGMDHLVHRDIKPANILVNKSGQVKISDFGCLKCLEDGQDARTFLGTKLYMSPERLNGQPYSTAADIWSVGVVAYECAFGASPFTITDFSSFPEVLLAVQKPLGVLPSYPNPDLSDFVSVCMRQDPITRPTAGDLLGHPFLQAPEVLQDPPKVLRSFLKTTQKHDRPESLKL